MSKVNIYIAIHKKAKVPNKTEYTPLHVGAEGKDDLGFVRDNTGDNISTKNPNYCELTGLYWMWKNDTSDITGLVHYRRYFFSKKNDNSFENIVAGDEIERILTDYDVIVPKKMTILLYTVGSSWRKFHNYEDVEKCRKIIENMYPEYLDAYDSIWKGNTLYPYNMLITKKPILDEYCQWLFSIFDELEKVVDISNYDNYNKRFYGFLSERLFNVWLNTNKKYKCFELPVYNTETSVTKEVATRTIAAIGGSILQFFRNVF